MVSPIQVRSRPRRLRGSRGQLKDCYYVVRFRARFSDKKTKIFKVFSLGSVGSIGDETDGLGRSQLDLHVTDG